MRLFVAPALVFALLVTACSKYPAPVPRRTAYPRTAEIDSTMRPVDSLPAYFEVNTAATVSRPGSGWLDIAYPMYGATVHITFTETSGKELADVRSNRIERALLNAGGLPTDRREWINQAGFDVLTMHTDRCATPFQFLATNDDNLVVSGAVYFKSPRAVENTDSIAPMLKIIEADLVRGLSVLR